MFCFLIPKIILKIPLKNLGLLTKTTFIRKPPIIVLSAAPTGNSEYYYPDREYRHQKFRRAKAAYKQPQGKSKPDSSLIEIEAFAHFVPSLQYQYIEKTKKCYSYLCFWAFQGFKSFNSPNNATYDLWRLSAISPFFTASITLQPFSTVWVQLVKRQPSAYCFKSRKQYIRLSLSS